MTGPWVAAFIVLWLLFVTLAIVVTGILRRSTATLERLDEYMQFQARTQEMSRLPLGVKVPRFTAYDVEGRLISSDELFRARTMVLFVGDSCQPCEELVEELMASDFRPQGIQFVVVGRLDTMKSLVARFESMRLRAFADSEAGEISRAFDNRVIPQAFVVDPPGTLVGANIPNTIRDLERMVERVEGGDSSVLSSGSA